MIGPNRRVKLDVHRLDGATISAGCFTCPLLQECGGYTRRGAAWSCMDRCATCDRSKCDLVCMKKPTDFARALLEVGGFGVHAIGHLMPRNAAEPLPKYAPVVQHSVGADVPLDWAAVPLRSVMRTTNGVYTPVATSPAALRARLGLHPRTKVIVLGIGKDAPLETYWRWRRVHRAPDALARLGIDCMIVPNYSVFLEEPRTHHLFNRKRSLLCAAELSAAGVPVVPYLHTGSPIDWKFWERFLREHEEISVLAEEFQTGLADPARGEPALAEISRLQEAVGRPIHLVAVGAARYRATLRARFDGWTLIDSEPYMKAIKRRVAAAVSSRRIRWEPALGEDVGDLVLHNSRRYGEWVDSGAHSPPPQPGSSTA
jgi:hypothetical protein